MKKSEPIYATVEYSVFDANIARVLSEGFATRADISIRWRPTSAGSGVHEVIQARKVIAKITSAQLDHRITIIVEAITDDLMNPLVKLISEMADTPWNRLMAQAMTK